MDGIHYSNFAICVLKDGDVLCVMNRVAAYHRQYVVLLHHETKTSWKPFAIDLRR